MGGGERRRREARSETPQRVFTFVASRRVAVSPSGKGFSREAAWRKFSHPFGVSVEVPRGVWELSGFMSGISSGDTPASLSETELDLWRNASGGSAQAGMEEPPEVRTAFAPCMRA